MYFLNTVKDHEITVNVFLGPQLQEKYFLLFIFQILSKAKTTNLQNGENKCNVYLYILFYRK